MAELRAEQDRYRENLELALQKQQRVVDSPLHLVEDMSGRLKRLEELQPLASGPELPAKPAAAELVERVKTLRGAMEKLMGGPAEAPYAPPRVDPGALPFVPMFSESTMLGEQTGPAGCMREGRATTDLRSLTVQMSHAAQDPPTTPTAHAVYAEEEIQSQTMQGRTMGSADGHGRGHPGGNLWVKDPTTGIWTAGGASPSCIPNPMGSGPTGSHSMEERDVRGVYSHPPATGGIPLGGVVAADVGDAVVVCFWGIRLHSRASLFLKIRNPKSQSTNLAGSLDGAPIITQSRRHKPCSKIEVSYSAHSQLSFDASLLFTDCQRDCDCDLRSARCCAAAVRSHNTTPPLRPRRGLTHLGGRHNVEYRAGPERKNFFLGLDMCWLQKHNSGPILVETHTPRCSHGTPVVSASFTRRVRLCHGCGFRRKLQKTTSPGTLHGRCTRSKAVGTSNHNIP